MSVICFQIDQLFCNFALWFFQNKKEPNNANFTSFQREPLGGVLRSESWFDKPYCSVAKSYLTLCDPMNSSTRPCPSLSPEVCSNSCPLSLWCYLTIISSAAPFCFCLQSFPASGYFPMSWLFASGGQYIGTSPLASVPPMNIQGWFPLGLTCLISLQPRRQESSPGPQFKSISSSSLSLLYCPTLTLIQDYWKNHSFDCMDLCLLSDVSAF